MLGVCWVWWRVCVCLCGADVRAFCGDGVGNCAAAAHLSSVGEGGGDCTIGGGVGGSGGDRTNDGEACCSVVV